MKNTSVRWRCTKRGIKKTAGVAIDADLHFFPSISPHQVNFSETFSAWKLFLVGFARPVKFHQVSLSQSAMQLRKTSVMKISHSSSYLWTRTSMFTPSRCSYNQHWVLICPEGSSAWIELLSWVRVSLMGGTFETTRQLKRAAGGVGLSWATCESRDVMRKYRRSRKICLVNISLVWIILFLLWDGRHQLRTDHSHLSLDTLFHPLWSGRCGHKPAQPVYKRSVWKGFVGDSDRRPTHSYHQTSFH